MIWTALASRRLGGSRDGLDLAFWAWTSVHRRCDRIRDPLHPSSVGMVHLLAGIRSPSRAYFLIVNATFKNTGDDFTASRLDWAIRNIDGSSSTSPLLLSTPRLPL